MNVSTVRRTMLSMSHGFNSVPSIRTWIRFLLHNTLFHPWRFASFALRYSLFALRSSLFALRSSLFALRYSLHRSTAPPRDIHFATGENVMLRRATYISPRGMYFATGERVLICSFVAPPHRAPRDIYFAREKMLLFVYLLPPPALRRATYTSQCTSQKMLSFVDPRF